MFIGSLCIVQVNHCLSFGGYKGFLECMGGLKNQTLNMKIL